VSRPLQRPNGRLSWGEALKESDLQGRITFISHAPTAAVRRAAFPLDEPIEERELEKLRLIGWVPPRVRQVYAGPEQRTKQTANALGLDPVLSAELKDLNYCSWRGKSLDEVQSRDQDGVHRWLTDIDAAPHGGESIANFLARIERWLAGQQGFGHTVAVTHPAVIRAAVVLTLQAPAQSFWRIDIPPVSITDLRWNGGFWNLRKSGCPFSGYEN
jgi:broad specificity phosphatase PhoE